jgi:ABC-type amino acid transport substrate-binding protein
MALFRRLALLVLLIGTGHAPALRAQTLDLVIGTDGANPPFSVAAESGELGGFEIELARAVCAQIRARCRFVRKSWDRLFPLLLTGRIDVVASAVAISDERRLKLGFSKPYYRVPAIFVARREDMPARTAAEALAGKVVGVEQGTPFVRLMAEHYPKAEVRLFGSDVEAALDLARGRVDLVLGDRLSLTPWLEGTTEGECCALAGPADHDDDILGPGLAFATRPADRLLRLRIDAALDTLVANGTFEGLAAKHLGFVPKFD